jgi:hypothetical protein
MSVFDATTKVKRAVSDPLSDHKLPHPKSLSWGAITSPSAVAGTNGAHCDLVHGDQWHEIKGNHNQNIQQNQTIKVVGKHKETLADSCYQNIIGPHTVLNNNVRNETRLGVFTKTYGDNVTQQDASSTYQIMGKNLQVVYEVQHLNMTSDFEICGGRVEVNGVLHAEYDTLHVEGHPLHAEAHGKHFALHGWSNHEIEFEDHMKEMENKIIWNTTDISAIENKTSGLKVESGVFSYEGEEFHTGPAVFAALFSPTVMMVP